jgi:hypothetical protein
MTAIYNFVNVVYFQIGVNIVGLPVDYRVDFFPSREISTKVKPVKRKFFGTNTNIYKA